jgi:hypothetical protein
MTFVQGALLISTVLATVKGRQKRDGAEKTPAVFLGMMFLALTFSLWILGILTLKLENDPNFQVGPRFFRFLVPFFFPSSLLLSSSSFLPLPNS